MQLQQGQVAVVTGAASGIGAALTERFAAAGLRIVLADVQADALHAQVDKIRAMGVPAIGVLTDVSKAEQVHALCEQTVATFGGVQIVCNNAGVASPADPWFGPIESWEWVVGVNFWGVVHGVRTFLPHLVGGGHIVNTASIAGLMPGFAPSYDASKHAVVAMTEHLFHAMQIAGLPIGVSVLCPGWVRTQIMDADRNYAGPASEPLPSQRVASDYVRRAIAEGMSPARVADEVAAAIEANRYWVILGDDFLELCAERWSTVADRLDPVVPENTPGMPPRTQLMAEIRAALGVPAAPPSNLPE